MPSVAFQILIATVTHRGVVLQWQMLIQYEVTAATLTPSSSELSGRLSSFNACQALVQLNF